jgi:hypothetical protein
LFWIKIRLIFLRKTDNQAQNLPAIGMNFGHLDYLENSGISNRFIVIRRALGCSDCEWVGAAALGIPNKN